MSTPADQPVVVEAQVKGLLDRHSTPPVGEELLVDYHSLHRIEDTGDGSVAFDLPTGEWLRLFREHGFLVESLRELRPPADAPPSRHTFVTLDWARQWPAEEIWCLTRAARAGR